MSSGATAPTAHAEALATLESSKQLSAPASAARTDGDYVRAGRSDSAKMAALAKSLAINAEYP